MIRWIWHRLFGGYACDGCYRWIRRWRGRATPRIETVVVPAVCGAPEGKYRTVRLYCRRCAENRKEGE